VISVIRRHWTIPASWLAAVISLTAGEVSGYAGMYVRDFPDFILPTASVGAFMAWVALVWLSFARDRRSAWWTLVAAPFALWIPFALGAIIVACVVFRACI